MQLVSEGVTDFFFFLMIIQDQAESSGGFIHELVFFQFKCPKLFDHFYILTKGQTLTFSSEKDNVSGFGGGCFSEVIKDLVAWEWALHNNLTTSNHPQPQIDQNYLSALTDTWGAFWNKGTAALLSDGTSPWWWMDLDTLYTISTAFISNYQSNIQPSEEIPPCSWPRVEAYW